MSSRIIHLTDLHLFADPLGEVRGVRTRETLERVLTAVNHFASTADRLIITGDLTHDEQVATYEFLRDRLHPWSSKLRVIPGNHDDRGHLRSVFSDRVMSCGERIVFSDGIGGWRLIGLDSHVPGQLHGELGPDQIEWLRAELRKHPGDPTCIFLHHPPVMVHSLWLDRIGLVDADPLWPVLRAAPHVRAVLCGHVHQERTTLLGPICVFTTPATGVQFRPETETLEVDTVSPGFRVVDLESDGSIRTRVERITD